MSTIEEDRAELAERIAAYRSFFLPVFRSSHPLPNSLRLASSILEKATVILSDMADPDPCEWDHNHSCQAHGYYYIPQGEKCPNQAAKDFIK